MFGYILVLPLKSNKLSYFTDKLPTFNGRIDFNLSIENQKDTTHYGRVVDFQRFSPEPISLRKLSRVWSIVLPLRNF